MSLGRSERLYWGSFPRRHSHRRQRVSSGATRRGTSSAFAKAGALQPKHARKNALRFGGHVLRSLQRPVRRRVGRKDQHGRFGIEVGQTHARGRNRHRGQVGRTYVRLAACHRSSCESELRSSVMRQKRKVVLAIVPARKREPHAPCPYVVTVAEVDKRHRVSNKLPRSAPKRVAVEVNANLAKQAHPERERRRAGPSERMTETSVLTFKF